MANLRAGDRCPLYRDVKACSFYCKHECTFSYGSSRFPGEIICTGG